MRLHDHPKVSSSWCCVRCSWRHMPRNLLITVFKGYKYLLSPFLPPACRFIPTCSQFAIEAVNKYGALRGLALAAWRLLRCHPFAKGGYDPVK